jgi:hypothetical protein
LIVGVDVIPGYEKERLLLMMYSPIHLLFEVPIVKLLGDDMVQSLIFDEFEIKLIIGVFLGEQLGQAEMI